MRDSASGPFPSFPGPGLCFGKMSDTAVADTRRLNSKPQDLTDAYGPPSNFLEIDIFNPQTVGVGRARFTTYEVRMRVSHGVRETAEGGPSGWAEEPARGTTNGGEHIGKGHLGVRGLIGLGRGLLTRFVTQGYTELLRGTSDRGEGKHVAKSKK